MSRKRNEDFSTELFLYLCKSSKLTMQDLEIMTIGNCLDFIRSYHEFVTDKDKPKVRQAQQSDFDRF